MDMDSHQPHPQELSTLQIKNKRKPRRSVSFRLKSTLFCYDVPENEQEWYTADDEDIFKAQAQKAVVVFQKMKGGFPISDAQAPAAMDDDDTQDPDPEDLCIVGLEQQLVSPDFTKKRAKTKKIVKYAVLFAQHQARRMDSDVDDKAERIADASIRYSQWSAAQAKMFGEFQYMQSKESR